MSDEYDIEKLIEFAVQSEFKTKCTVIKRQSRSWYFRFVINTPEKTNEVISPLYKTTFGAVECTWHFTAFNCHLIDRDDNFAQFAEYYEAKKEGREI